MLVARALPVNQGDAEALSTAGSAAAAGVVDMKPADPVEAILIAQMLVANEAALELYRRGWANVVAGYLDASTKFLHLADKSSRTVAMLAEKLNQHRGRGQQQITVKHVTVNADQALVTDQIVTEQGKEAVATNLLTHGTYKPTEIVQPAQKEPGQVMGGGSEAK